MEYDKTMFETPYFMTNPDWYYEKKIDEYRSKLFLTKAAPKKAVKSYRCYCAKYYCTDSGRIILGEYEDVDGKIYIVDIHGNIIKKGRVNRKIFTGDVYM